ncbi:MAG: DUF4430 domain-containing protein [Planctomycetota bacterium]|jgi:hypothetical protein
MKPIRRSHVAGLLRVLAATGCLAVALVAVGFAPRPAPPPAVHRVRLVVDYNDGVQKHFTALPWKKGMTVLDAMKLAKASPHGITFEYRGSAADAFLTRIDDLENQGGEADKKNWLFWVNTRFADRSFGIQELEPADVVLWRFGKWEDR